MTADADQPTDELLAKARLEAAVPDLLAACRAIVACDVSAEDGWGTLEWCEGVQEAIDQARAAITKATAQP